MRNCNNCKYCLRILSFENEDYATLKFLCAKRDNVVLRETMTTDYQMYAEPECAVDKKDCPLSKEYDASNNIEISEQPNNVNHPSHYSWLKEKCGVEVYEITRHFCFNIGNALKYLMRAGHKKDADKTEKEKEIEDLKKAKWYIEEQICCLENNIL